MTTDQKGAVAETAIVHAATKLGIEVFRPLIAASRCDLVFGIGRDLLRVQCKWAAVSRGGIPVRCYSSRRCADGFRHRRYTTDEVDAIAVYCPDVDRCYFLPLGEFDGPTHIRLRLEPTLNNQSAGIRWAGDFEFAATLGAPGAIAQLGERLLCKQEVTGSIPVGSTNLMFVLRSELSAKRNFDSTSQ